MTDDETVEFAWSNVPGATYTLKVQKYTDGVWENEIFETDITENSYTPAAELAAGGIYRATVTAYVGYTAIMCQEYENGGLYFQAYSDPDKHPANVGIDYSFNGSITETVLNNYLDRAVTCEMFPSTDSGVGRAQMARNNIRMFLNCGVKYVSRAVGAFNPSSGSVKNTVSEKTLIEYAHSLDPDIIFEAGIYEAISASANTITIPEWVFAAFGKEYESRRFDYTLMVFEDGSYTDEFGTGVHGIDITREESQMFYYFLARTYIDMGVEALHFGQTRITAANDTDYACYEKLFTMVREYAKTNARRGMVLINSHNGTSAFKRGDKLLIDFLAEPAAIYDVSGEEAHLPSEDNPQIAEIRSWSGVWTKKLSGYTPSGWHTDNLPCYAEFDNWMTAPGSLDEISSTTGIVDIPWGYDEISWFANQPAAYRHSFMNYMYETVKEYNSNAHVCFPASRPAYSIEKGKMSYYRALDTMFSGAGFGDEAALKQLFINSNS